MVDEFQMFSLCGVHAVVTGGGRGLGRSITEAYLAAGADVTVMGRHGLDPELLAFASDRGHDLLHVTTDLADGRSLAAAAAKVLEARPVDVLVNNAGLQVRHPAEDFPLEDFDRVMAINLRAVFDLSQRFARPMLERGRGKIINIASMTTFQGGVRVSAYASAKGAVGQLTKALCNEWSSRGVNVNAIAPGYMATDLNEALLADPVRSQEILARIPAGRWGQSDDLAGAAIFLASKASDYVSGAVLPVDGGWLAR